MKVPPPGSDNPQESSDAENGQSSNGSQVTQQHEDTMFAAIDTFCRKREQTYEEFMQCFVHLKPEDVRQNQPPAAVPDQFMHSSQVLSGLHSDQENLPEHTSVEKKQGSSSINITDDDCLQEEVLTEGSRLPEMLLRQNDGCHKPIVQFDNFVEFSPNMEDSTDTDDVDEEDVDPSATLYLASFGHNQIPESRLSVEDASNTDNDVVIQDSDSEPDTSSSNMTSCHCVQRRDSAGDRYDDTTVRYDSTGAVLTRVPSEAADSDSDSKDDELRYDPSLDLPNPGEVLDELVVSQIADVTNIRQMSYSAKIGFDTHSSSGEFNLESVASCEISSVKESSAKEAVCEQIDLVQPFTLDENFDYDNVVLTPKFSKEDIEFLKNV